MKKSLSVLSGLVVSCVTSICFALPYNQIKLAVFDNPTQDVSRAETSQELVNSYLAGIATAVKVAASENIHIQRKEFFYSDNVLEIMHKAADAKGWQPNVVMGFHASNDFIMAKSFFGDQLTLSIAATDQKLSLLPLSFYSVGTPDVAANDLILKFIKEHYPKSNLYIVVGAESKESADFGSLLAKTYRKQFSGHHVTEYSYLTEDMDMLNMKDMVPGYRQGDVIVSLSQGYFSSIKLMNKIAKSVSPIQPIFVTVSDNWGDGSTPEAMHGKYDAFRIDFLSDGKNTKQYQIFAKNYQEIYHVLPKDTISFVTYRAVMSFITALKRYPPPSGMTTTEAILWSYQQALKHDPDWFRSKQYTVFKLGTTKEMYFETL